MFDNIVMETLRQHIDTAKPRLTHEEWAKRLGISRSHLTEIVNGTAHPGRSLILRIEQETGGRVKPAIWFKAETQ